MKLVYITASFPFGPGEAFLIPEVAALLDLGHQLTIVPWRPLGPILHEVPTAASLRTLRENDLSASVLRSALRQFQEQPAAASRPLGEFLKSDRLRVFLRNVRLYPKALWLARFVQAWRPDHIHAHWAVGSASLAMIASRITGVPWSFTAHRYDILEKDLLQPKMEDAAFCRFISRDGMRLAERQGNRLNEKSIVLHMGVELPEPPEPKQAGAEFIVFCPANLVPIKGHEHLIEAMALLRHRGLPIQLLLAGHGVLKPDLEAQVARLGLGACVRFLGQLPHASLLQMYRRKEVDLVVLPSLYEGIPVSLMEAMGHGVPVVGTTAGGTPELLEEEAGVLVPPADASALANAIETLATSQALRESLAVRGRQRIEQHFDVKRIVSQMIDAFAKSGAGRGVGRGAAPSTPQGPGGP